MANPAPTINQINAFNATQGTVIDFNIIGGTELVRSNKIYIYDLSDNSLICTHLYPSTESIHELPPNNDADIVYADGKSSADFVNNKQYYAQIQTFTNVAGTQGESGLSVAKLFWCLPTPSLEFDTIPASISITSYNATATYDSNITSQSVTVPNIVQQYQFDLYTVTGTLVQSSGVIVGNGEQEGATTVWDLSYNFSGMTPNTSYYFTLSVTTTEGMTLTTQSSTFMVSIDTPTLGKATVVNDACNGYISVTSNLSSEYGGSASGSIASFTVDSVNHVSKCEVTLEPIQDLNGYESPWVGGGGKNKFIAQNGTNTNRGITGTLYDTNYLTFSGKATETGYGGIIVLSSPITLEAGTYTVSLSSTTPKQILLLTSSYTSVGSIAPNNNSATFTLTESKTISRICVSMNLDDELDIKGYIQIESGSTATSFAPYSNICPISGRSSVGVTGCGENLFDKNRATDGSFINGNGVEIASNSYGHSELIRIKPSTSYCMTGYAGNSFYSILALDKDKNPLTTWYGGASKVAPFIATTPGNAKYCYINYFLTQKDTVSLYEASAVGDFIPYLGTTHTIPLGQTVYGGTLDAVSGVLTIDRASVVLSSSSSPRFSEVSQTTTADGTKYVAYIPHSSYGMKNGSESICDSYAFRDADTSNLHVGEFNTRGSYDRFVLADQSLTTLTALNNYLDNNPIQLCYELDTPTTIQLTPTQIACLLGQNNIFSDSGDVAIEYNILITNLLVKRKDLSDVSGTWLTLYEKPILQASDMDFTYIDFLNQYGKTYQYALVPLLIQSQSGVVVEVEGGYTVSDNVTSQFDYVFITDVTGSEKLKANVGYGNVNMSQNVGSILPIGAKYPVVVTNSHNAYHSGSISGYIVPDDFYTNGNLSRVAMVAKRDELEQFLVNKKPKIIKDWNGKIWLVMITGDVDCSFDSNYGMGMVTFTASWVEVGDATSQEDLQNTGLINVGGV